ncbi:hypothetical protein GCK32_017200 [Trichostrongylus colubriformis]|uniref:Uncharacterized protein n=1 Tax=Trichostrongylus colubriformis TaxID=6319 RepID=A0AAN8FTV8_TRICO
MDQAAEAGRICHDSAREGYRSSGHGIAVGHAGAVGRICDSAREGRRLSCHGAMRGIDYRDAECDRASYRNFAYERDMGRVAPLEGFDQLETCEQRRHVCEDEDYDVVERDVKRTHTSRFVQETRHVDDDDRSSTGERFREEDVQHAYYSQSVPV